MSHAATSVLIVLLGVAALQAQAQAPIAPPPPTPGAFVPQSVPFKTDSVEIRLAPKEGMEYKYRLDKGGGLLFTWQATAALHYELHSEPDSGPKGYAETFDKHDSREVAHGNYIAPFAGIHGWYWENRTDREVIVRLVAAGNFTESLEFRRKQDVKRKAFN